MSGVSLALNLDGGSGTRSPVASSYLTGPRKPVKILGPASLLQLFSE